jgi:hypothetical protein
MTFFGIPNLSGSASVWDGNKFVSSPIDAFGNGENHISFKGNVIGTAAELIGSYYSISTFTLSSSSFALAGVLPEGSATLRMVRESNGNVAATWTSSSPLESTSPSVLLDIVPGWYTFDLAANSGSSTAVAYGVTLVKS